MLRSWLKKLFAKKPGGKTDSRGGAPFNVRPEDYGRNVQPKDVAWRGTFGDARTNHPGGRL